MPFFIDVSVSDLDSEGSKRRKLLNESSGQYDSTSQDEEFDCDDNLKDETKLCPNFSSYLYFLFAPTLVYRDSYPRYFIFK